MIFDLEKLKKLTNQTPFFVFNKQALLDNVRIFKKELPSNTEICYAMKANSEKVVLETLKDEDVSFEVASKFELSMLKKIGVQPSKIIYGTSVKPESHIKEFVKYGVKRFAFDSEQELIKISKLAPGSQVYVRALVDDRSESVFHMSEKFGIPLEKAIFLLKKAQEFGLKPIGISFNVGSQARNEKAWANGIDDISDSMKVLLKDGIKIETINLGGGFPYTYNSEEAFPAINKIAKHIHASDGNLPYKVNYIAEPGRVLVANAFVLVVSVVGRCTRQNGEWLYIDAGVYNALLEAMTCQGSTKYQILVLKSKNSFNKSGKTQSFILTGPTGDNLDVISRNVVLPDNLQEGDKLLISDVGAYTFPLITKFNGFPKPKIVAL